MNMMIQARLLLIATVRLLSFVFCGNDSEDGEEDGTVQRGHPGGDHRARAGARVYRRGTSPDGEHTLCESSLSHY